MKLKRQDEYVRYNNGELKLYKKSRVICGADFEVQKDPSGNYIVYKLKGQITKDEAKEWLDDVKQNVMSLEGPEKAEEFYNNHLAAFGLKEVPEPKPAIIEAEFESVNTETE